MCLIFLWCINWNFNYMNIVTLMNRDMIDAISKYIRSFSLSLCMMIQRNSMNGQLRVKRLYGFEDHNLTNKHGDLRVVIWCVCPCWSKHEWNDEQQWTSRPVGGQWLPRSHGWRTVTRILYFYCTQFCFKMPCKPWTNMVLTWFRLSEIHDELL